MDVAILLFDAITPLDAIGPFEVLGRLPGSKIKMVGKEKGAVRTVGGSLSLNADYAISEIERADVLLVPGGFGADAVATDPDICDWVKRIHETTTWTTAVCTGSLILGSAGLLNGVRATSHWRAVDFLKSYGALPVRERIVFDGKIATSAGVSAGIDMALALAAKIAGQEIAEAIQLGMEYAPQPPFDAGRFEDAPQSRIDKARTGLNRP